MGSCEMTSKELQALMPKEKPYNRGCGDGLLVNVESIKKGGGKSFAGTMRQVIGGKKRQITVRVGRVEDLSLKQARLKWLAIKQWAIQEGRDPREYKTKDLIIQEKSKTLGDAVDSFLQNKEGSIRETTLRNYRYQLNNQVFRCIDPGTSLKDLEWDAGGRSRVMELRRSIEARGSLDQAHRCQRVLKHCLEHAISRGWMDRRQNPATQIQGEDSKHLHQHHPSIPWEEVPLMLKEIHLNRCNAHQTVVQATKFMLLTFLRTGALARLQWDWIDGDLLVIPGTTPGLKRTKKTENKPHHVPLTKEMNRVLEVSAELNGDTPYVFSALTSGGRYPHLNPEAPNNFLKALGYRDRLRAHGWRQLPLTVGQDVLKIRHPEVIQRQMGHLIKEKVRKAYDHSLLLDERRDFLNQWGNLLCQKGLVV